MLRGGRGVQGRAAQRPGQPAPGHSAQHRREDDGAGPVGQQD